MKNLFDTLCSLYSFEVRGCGIFWGIGSLMWGDTVAIKAIAADLYEITTHHWRYNEWGEPVVDTTTTTVAHGGQVWGLIPTAALKGRKVDYSHLWRR